MSVKSVFPLELMCPADLNADGKFRGVSVMKKIWKKDIKKYAIALAAAGALTVGSPGGIMKTPAASDPASDTLIREVISGMTTEEKLAQMMIVALRSDAANTNTATQLSADYAALIRKYDFGGIILFTGNIEDTAQTVTLIRDSQEAAMRSEQGIPMFVCVDQEGGMVNRVSFGMTSSGNMALAAAGDPSLAEESARMMGEEIHALGFNMDFAPVSDVNSNPANPIIGVRSFSDDPEMTAEYVTSFIRGLKAAGISSALKHFPGHGNVGEDSHTHLPCSDFSLDEIKACDLIPFQAGIDEGTDMIMTAHIQYPKIETGTYTSVQDGKDICLPATLSRTIISGLLREQMGYDGIVITDAMGMDAIASHFDPIDAAVLAINAGVDILLCPVDLYLDEEINTFTEMDSYMERLLARVENGEIPEEELDDSVFRILKLKKEKGIDTDAVPAGVKEQISQAEAVVGSADHHIREWEIAQAGMTLLKNEKDALPLDGTRTVLILYPTETRKPSVDYAVSRMQKEKLLDSSLVTEICCEELSFEDAALLEALKKAEQVVILSQSVSRNEEICKVIDQVHQDGKKAVLLSLNLPYDAACYPEADAVLCAYQPYGSAHDEEGNGPFNLNVAVALCTAFNQTVPSGTLPVNVPEIRVEDGEITFEEKLLYERGYGLKNWEMLPSGTEDADRKVSEQMAETSFREIPVTEIDAVRIGQTENAQAGTGCTVFVCEDGMRAGLDIRGGGPASRETPLLNPLMSAQTVHAIVLAGGSAFGLDAAGGVMRCLEERGIGYDVGVTKVPLVVQSDIFDLTVGDVSVRPDADMGYEAAERALDDPNYCDGNYGVGCGATAGKICGMDFCMKTGIGSYAIQAGDLKIGAVVVVNALGDVFDWKTGKQIAGLLTEDKTAMRSTAQYMRGSLEVVDNRFVGNTTLAVVLTNACFDKSQLCKIAGMAQNGYARSIHPVHTSADGDSIYAVSAGEVPADQDLVGTLAAEIVSEAITRAVENAKSAFGYPCAADLQ